MKSVIFDTRQVNATLESKMSQFRVPVKLSLANRFDPPRGKADVEAGYPFVELEDGFHSAAKIAPLGKVGDRFFIKETFFLATDYPIPGTNEKVFFKSDINLDFALKYEPAEDRPKWSSSVHMLQHQSQLTLEITNVRVERVQEISEDDAKKEGFETLFLCQRAKLGFCEECQECSVKFAFYKYWDSKYSKKGRGWDFNPWVWVYEFKVVD